MTLSAAPDSSYAEVLAGVVELLEKSRRVAARTVNSVMTATYWDIGRRIVLHEQHGEARAAYGEELIKRLAADLTARFGRGFGAVNLSQMKKLYLEWPPERIFQTPSEKSAGLTAVAKAFPLPWSNYVLLLSVKDEAARRFYETEALRGGWSVRQLTRQIESMFYERTALSRNKAAMLTKGARAKPEDAVTPEEEIKDPLVLEFLGLKDEYSETDLEDALVHHLESFLLELGGDFCFVARQRRLRIDDVWFRVDLVFFHRGLRCLVLIDLKLGPFSHADAGQMHVYLNYAKEHWTKPGENPPVGLILCANKRTALARYATEGLPNPMVVREYLTALPEPAVLEAEIEKTRRQLEARGAGRS